MASVFGGEAPVWDGPDFIPHSGQEEISDALEVNFWSEAPAAIVEIICSRGWGKTLYIVCEILIPFLDKNPNAKVMWVAPTYQIAMAPIDDVLKGVNELTGERYVSEFDAKGRRLWEFVTTKSGPILKWWNGATVSFKSADSPDSIVSKGYNRIIIDEAALVEEQVFLQQILGTARKQGIKIFLITTPRGKKHWTYRFFLKGQDPAQTEYISFQQPFQKNPYFSEVLKRLIKDIPDWIFRQEYLAEFIDDGDAVFRGLEDVIFGAEIDYPSQQQEWERPVTDIELAGFEGPIVRKAEERRFAAGLDIAKSVDYSVLTVMDCETGDLMYYRRLNKMDYRELLRATTEVCKRFNQAELIFDATGVGSGLADVLQGYDVISHPFVFTNDSKGDLVNKLILSVEYKEISLPNIKTLKGEMQAFTYTMTRTGKISYNAPSGFHDDIVMSLALVNWFRKENSTDQSQVEVLEEVIGWNNGSGRAARPGSFREYIDNDND